MNKLSTERRAQILGMMVEGNSIRAIVRMTGASKNTIVKLLEDAGEAFSAYQDRRSAAHLQAAPTRRNMGILLRETAQRYARQERAGRSRRPLDVGCARRGH